MPSPQMHAASFLHPAFFLLLPFLEPVSEVKASISLLFSGLSEPKCFSFMSRDLAQLEPSVSELSTAPLGLEYQETPPPGGSFKSCLGNVIGLAAASRQR